jgi:WD40 repeat protein
MEEQDKIRFHKFLKEKAIELKKTATKIFLVEFDPDTQGMRDEDRAETLQMSQETYVAGKRSMYKQLGVSGQGFKREAYFRQLLREFSESPSEQERKRLEIEQLNSQSQSLFSSNDQLGALLAAVKAGRKLQGIEVSPALKIRTLARLHQAVYGVQELNRLQGHKSIVTSVSCSPNPNSKMLASASEDGTVRLWSFDGTFEDLKYRYGYHMVLDISFCPKNNPLLAVASLEAASLLNLEGNELQRLPHSDYYVDYVESISFSPNGQLLASIDDRGTVKLWRLNGDEPKTFQDRGVRAVSFSHNSQLLACATWDETVELWNLDGIIQKNIIRDRTFNSICFSPVSMKLAAASEKCLFLRTDSLEFQQIYEHSCIINNVSFSLDGKMLDSASSDGTIKLWKLDGDELHELKTFRGHRGEINKVSFSSDGRVLASAGQDGTVRLWSLENRKVPTLRGHSKSINQISFSPDGNMLASASDDGTVKLWSIDGRELNTLPKYKNSEDKHNACIKRVSFTPTPNSETLISFCDRGNVKLWNINGIEQNTFNVEVRFGVYDMSLSPDGQTLAVTDEDDFNNINLWSINGTRIKPLGEAPWWTALSPPIFTSFSPDGHTIACADRHGQVKLYSYYDGYDKELNNFEAHNSPINDISFSLNGLLALAGEDGTVGLWPVDGKEFKTFHAHGDKVTSVSFSPDGKILASASDDGTVKLWRIEGSELHTSELHTFEGHTDAVNSVSFSPDGQMLASASTDGTIILWNLNLDELLVQGCDWLRDYLKTNPNVSESDRHLCDGIGTQK